VEKTGYIRLLVEVHNQIEVSLKRDGRTDFDGSDVTILTISLFLSHLAAQLSHHFSPSVAGVFTTELELGLLMSSVDASGAELAGSLHWYGTSDISAFSKDRVLLTSGAQKNWGISGGLRYAPNGGEEGLMVSLEPSLGSATQQLLSNLWSESVRTWVGPLSWVPSSVLSWPMASPLPLDC